jgi:hypothetical protein
LKLVTWNLSHETCYLNLLIETCNLKLFTCYLKLVTWNILLKTCYMKLVTWNILLKTCYMKLASAEYLILISGSRMLPGCIRMVQVWFKYASSILQPCFKYASSILQVCFKYALSMLHVCFKYASSMLQVCFKYASSMPQVCLKYASSMIQVCFKWASSMLQVCFKYASSIFQVCLGFKWTVILPNRAGGWEAGRGLLMGWWRCLNRNIHQKVKGGRPTMWAMHRHLEQGSPSVCRDFTGRYYTLTHTVSNTKDLTELLLVDNTIEPLRESEVWDITEWKKEVWSMWVEDQPLQEAIMMKIKRQEQKQLLIVAKLRKEERVGERVGQQTTKARNSNRISIPILIINLFILNWIEFPIPIRMLSKQESFQIKLRIQTNLNTMLPGAVPQPLF